MHMEYNNIYRLFVFMLDIIHVCSIKNRYVVIVCLYFYMCNNINAI